MKARWLLLLLLAWHLPAQQVTMPAEPIVFGAAFELVVTAPGDFDANRLVPLVVELLDRTPAGEHEQWRFRARCYEVGEVVLSLDPPVKLTVATSLPDPRGELEWPSEGWLLAAPPGSSWWWWTAFSVVAVVLLWWRYSRKPAEAEPAVQATPEPDWDAMAALQQLLLPSDGANEHYYQQLKAIVRRHCHARFRVPADVRTSEELVLALPKAQATLQPCLSTCDVVLFGGIFGGDQNHQGAKDSAIAFVAATRSAASQSTEAVQ